MLALLGALQEEISGLREKMTIEEESAQPEGQFYRGKYGNKPVVLVQTGMGKERAEMAASLVLEKYPVTALVSFGFGGGLTEGAKVGDIILCATLCGDGGGETCSSDGRMLSLSCHTKTGAATYQGKSVTVARVASRPETKAALAQTFQSDVVDMESYWVARLAAARNIPFLGVRVISDEWRFSLEPFRGLFTNGGWRWYKAATRFLSHPQYLPDAWRLYRDMQRAKRSLTAFMGSFIAGYES